MIAFLKGSLISKNSNSVIILVRDIGYRVYCGERLLGQLETGSETEFYIYHHIKEESSDLYGFNSTEDLDIFTLLLSISGVGPKSALGVLSTSSASDVSEAIIRGDAELLTKVSGIGKKTAERIVLELKTKIGRLPSKGELNLDSSLVGSDEIDALMSLGYSLQEARSALNGLPEAVLDSGERVKLALRKMKKI